MDITINNLGPINKETSIELKPLTVFVGPNNAGKTWTAYTLSALFGSRAWSEYRDAYLKNETTGIYLPLDDAIEQLFNSGSTKIDLIDFFKKFGQYYFNDLVLLEKQWFPDFLGSSSAAFQDLKISVNLEKIENKVTKNILSYFFKADYSIDKDGKALLYLRKEKNDPVIFFYTSSSETSENSTLEPELKEKFSKQILKDIIYSTILRIISRSIYFNIYIFPSERTAFKNLTELLDAISKIKFDPKNEKSEADDLGKMIIPDPIVDLTDLLHIAARLGSHEKRQKELENNENIKIYLELAEILQEEILQGKVDYSDPEPNPSRELIFKPSNSKEISLDIPATSSMVKDLSPLVLYLRYLAGKRHLLVIDEPEMNLHPEAQAKLIELIAMLVNADIHVIITTHSPYIVDHLINLMKAADSKNSESIVDKFFLKNSNAFISKDNVSVYLFADGTAKSILEEDGFIEWETFNQVSQQILDLRMEL